MKRKVMIWTGLAMLSIMGLVGSARRVHSQAPPYQITLQWVRAAPKHVKPAAPPNVGPPIAVATPGADIAAALNASDPTWTFKPVAALSAAAPRVESFATNSSVVVPDGTLSLRPLSVVVPKNGVANARFGFNLKAKENGYGMSTDEFSTNSLEIGKAYLISTSAPVDHSYELLVFVSVLPGGL